MKTWHDFLQDNSGRLYYAPFGRMLNYEYLSWDPDAGIFYYNMHVKPTDFGNYATFNGCFSLRFKRDGSVDNVLQNYNYELGYFDFTMNNRVYEASTSNGMITVTCYDVQAAYDSYVQNGYLGAPYGETLVNYVQDLVTAGTAPAKNEKLVSLAIKQSYITDGLTWHDVAMALCVYPNIKTTEELTGYWYDRYEEAENHRLIAEENCAIYEKTALEADATIKDLETQLSIKQSQIDKLHDTNRILQSSYDQVKEKGGVITSFLAGIGQGFSNFFTPILDISFLGVTIGSVVTVAIVIFVTIIVLKAVRGS